MDNKKTLILSIIGVLVLVAAVIGISFAMYNFSATGTRENVIRTGSVSLGSTCTTLSLTNQYPMADAVGSQLTGTATLTCPVTATISGAMTLNYEVALTAVTEGSTLKDDYVKMNVTKNGTYILGTSASTGITVASRAANKGSLITDGYLIDSGSFTQSGTTTYVIRAWVADNYDLPGTMSNSNGVHTQNTTSETFSFKFKVVAAQA